jgi:cytochrome P450/NADPH-cytochrome P450 reductase
VKPDGFRIRVRRRSDRDRARPASRVNGRAAALPAVEAPAAAAGPRHGTPLLVLYGSNLGTAEEVARRVAEWGEAGGFAVTVAPLDEYTARLPTTGAVVIASASYNGTPPDNATRFCEWLRAADPAATSLVGVRYSVFGCGNRDWASTFQAVPRLIDERLAALGAERLYARGEGDAREDFDGQVQAWHEPLGGTLAKALGVELAAGAPGEAAHLAVEPVESGDASPLGDSLGARAMRVAVNRELHTKTGPDASTRSTRHLELELPEGGANLAGDKLGEIAIIEDASRERVGARDGV